VRPAAGAAELLRGLPWTDVSSAQHRLLSLLQDKALGSYRGYHRHSLLRILQGKALGSYRKYHRHRLLRILQGKALEVLHGTDVSSAQVTVHTTGYGCGGVTLYHQDSRLLHVKNMKCKSPGLRGLSEISKV
jgi:hypothetical protein